MFLLPHTAALNDWCFAWKSRDFDTGLALSLVVLTRAGQQRADGGCSTESWVQ
ncbi:hypothetical protein SDJN02_18776, partial [Cucurbita argyrosperma subsp. argyrosperma]